MEEVRWLVSKTRVTSDPNKIQAMNLFPSAESTFLIYKINRLGENV